MPGARAFAAALIIGSFAIVAGGIAAVERLAATGPVTVDRVFGVPLVQIQVDDDRLRRGILSEIARRRGALVRTDDPVAHFSPDNPSSHLDFRPVDTTGIVATLLDSGHVVHTWTSPAFDRLFQLMRAAATVFGTTLGVKPAPAVDSAWVHVTRDGGEMGWHHHGERGVSEITRVACVFYAATGEPGEEDPDSGCVFYRDDAWNLHRIAPRNGLLTLVPAHLYHRVHRFAGRGERVIVGCNLRLYG